jgi:hypothetical protein
MQVLMSGKVLNHELCGKSSPHAAMHCVGPYWGKIQQPLGFTLHTKIHKWMINSTKEHRQNTQILLHPNHPRWKSGFGNNNEEEIIKIK